MFTPIHSLASSLRRLVAQKPQIDAPCDGPAPLERLESFVLLSAVLSDATLYLTGTNFADTIVVFAGLNPGDVTVIGVDGVADGTGYVPA
jgi:hypothetical protein